METVMNPRVSSFTNAEKISAPESQREKITKDEFAALYDIVICSPCR